MANHTTFGFFAYSDALEALRMLSNLDNFDYNPGTTRGRRFEYQLRSTYMTGTTAVLHCLLQMSAAERVRFARVFCGTDHAHSSAVGVESIFFTLASNPETAKVLFDAAPLSQWLGHGNIAPEVRGGGAAVLDLRHLSDTPPVFGSGLLLSEAKVSSLMKGGNRYQQAVNAGPQKLYQLLWELRDGSIVDAGKKSVKLAKHSAMEDILVPAGDGGDVFEAPPTAAEVALEVTRAVDAGSRAAVQTAQAATQSSDELDSLGDTVAGETRRVRHPRQWSLGTWALAFGACAALMAAGALLVPLLAGTATIAGFLSFQAAMFTADAAIIKFADGVLDMPSLSVQTTPTPNVPEELYGFVIVLEGTVTRLYIDDVVDATPTQVP